MIGIVLVAMMGLSCGVCVGNNADTYLGGAVRLESRLSVLGFDAQLPCSVVDCAVTPSLVCHTKERQQAAERTIGDVEGFAFCNTPSFGFSLRNNVWPDAFFIQTAFRKFGGMFDSPIPKAWSAHSDMSAGVYGWRSADILYVEANEYLAADSGRVHGLGSDLAIEPKEGAGLLDVDSPLVINLLSGYPEGCQQKNRPYPHKRSLNADIISLPSHEIGLFSSDIRHSLSGKIHFLRSRIHSLLGDKIVFIVLVGFGFAALAGIGLGMLLDDFNTDRRVGWLLLLSGLPLFALCFLLGLP